MPWRSDTGWTPHILSLNSIQVKRKPLLRKQHCVPLNQQELHDSFSSPHMLSRTGPIPTFQLKHLARGRALMVGSGLGAPVAQMVSPMATSARPVSAQMSPASACSTGTRLKLSYTNSSATRPARGFSSPAAHPGAAHRAEEQAHRLQLRHALHGCAVVHSSDAALRMHIWQRAGHTGAAMPEL